MIIVRWLLLILPHQFTNPSFLNSYHIYNQLSADFQKF